MLEIEPLEPDIVERVHADFPPDQVPLRLIQLAAMLRNHSARVLRCILFEARGHPRHFECLCQRAELDDRDVIMMAEYGASHAPLYDFTKPFDKARLD